MTMTMLKAERGVTLIEATVVLATSAILIAAMAPLASRTVEISRMARAQADVDAIATAIDNFIDEHTTFVPFTSTGAAGGDIIEMLVGDGDIPTLGSGGGANWDDVVACCGGAVDVAFLVGHLVTNSNLGGVGSYTTAAGGWKGAYLNGPVDPDPWGNRYAVNAESLKTTTANDTFVLSAGPDEEVDTAFTYNGARPGDDDLISVVRRDVGLVVP
jgi:type II secretory pathway pseudopilin PulG